MAKQGIQELDYKRQEATIRGLPKGFKYPLFSGWQAIQSQRKSGYKTTARAAREIIDNSIEAGADNVYVVFDVLPDKARKPYQRKNTVTSIAFIDDGPGMIHHDNERSMLRYALSWGGGTHFDDPQLIGKFGFGLRPAWLGGSLPRGGRCGRGVRGIRLSVELDLGTWPAGWKRTGDAHWRTSCSWFMLDRRGWQVTFYAFVIKA